MKIALNNRNIILKSLDGVFDCYQCCFLQNWSFCGLTELRDATICRTTKTFDCSKLYDIFKL